MIFQQQSVVSALFKYDPLWFVLLRICRHKQAYAIIAKAVSII